MTLCEERVVWQRAGVGVGVGELGTHGEEHKGQIKVMAMRREGKEGSETWVDLGLTGIQRCEQGGEDSKAE